MKYDYAVYLGRFAPFHVGHYHIVKEALKIADRVILILSSHDKARCIRNPFTSVERSAIIEAALLPDEWDRIIIRDQVDYTYNDTKWIGGVQSTVHSAVWSDKWTPDGSKICLVGYAKDETSRYLRWFPQWDLVWIEPARKTNATDIRKRGYTDTLELDFNSWECNEAHRDLVFDLFKSPQVQKIAREYSFIQAYKAKWDKSPYPPTFQTADALVEVAGHILLVERKDEPGKGLWALPGGFVNVKERIEDAALRELKEETLIDVPEAVLRRCIVNKDLFDDPHRSDRGRTITQCYHFQLNPTFGVPRVKGGDDAANAFWVTIEEARMNRSNFFEDHWSIIEAMLKL